MNDSEFLILSDLHFGSLGFEPAFRCGNEDDLFKNNCPVAGIREICKGHQISGIIAPGDLTSKGAPAEFHGAKRLIDSLANQLGLTNEDIILTYGNHDVDWRIGKLGDADSETSEDLRYREVASSVGHIIAPCQAKPTKVGPLPGSGLYEFGNTSFYVINSGVESHHSQPVKHGKIRQTQLNWLKDLLSSELDRSRFHILVVHHHLFPHQYPEPLFDVSLLEEAPQVVALAGKAGIDLIIHGHCHHPRLTTLKETGWLHAMSILCCGSVGVNGHHRDNGNIPNLFHILKLESRNSFGQCIGSVSTYGYSGSGTWEKKAFHRRNNPIDPTACFGPAISHADAVPLAKKMLDTAISSGNSMVEIKDLPYELRCMGITEIISIIKAEAASLHYSVHETHDGKLIFLK